MSPGTAQLWTIYLLHFERPIGRSLHYLGITRHGRIEKRMAEHCAGRGAVITSKAVEQGLSWWLVSTFEPADYNLERRMKQAGHYARLCPICSAGLDAATADRQWSRYRPREKPPSPWKGLGW